MCVQCMLKNRKEKTEQIKTETKPISMKMI